MHLWPSGLLLVFLFQFEEKSWLMSARTVFLLNFFVPVLVVRGWFSMGPVPGSLTWKCLRAAFIIGEKYFLNSLRFNQLGRVTPSFPWSLTWRLSCWMASASAFLLTKSWRVFINFSAATSATSLSRSCFTTWSGADDVSPSTKQKTTSAMNKDTVAMLASYLQWHFSN